MTCVNQELIKMLLCERPFHTVREPRTHLKKRYHVNPCELSLCTSLCIASVCSWTRACAAISSSTLRFHKSQTRWRFACVKIRFPNRSMLWKMHFQTVGNQNACSSNRKCSFRQERRELLPNRSQALIRVSEISVRAFK